MITVSYSNGEYRCTALGFANVTVGRSRSSVKRQMKWQLHNCPIPTLPRFARRATIQEMSMMSGHITMGRRSPHRTLSNVRLKKTA